MKTAVAEQDRRNKIRAGLNAQRQSNQLRASTPQRLRAQAGPPRSPAEAARRIQNQHPDAQTMARQAAQSGRTLSSEERANASPELRGQTRPRRQGQPFLASRQLLHPTAEGQRQGPQRRWPGPVTDAQHRPSTPRVEHFTGPNQPKRTNPRFANVPRPPKPAAVNHRPAFKANPRLADSPRVPKPAATDHRAAFKTVARAQTLPTPKPTRKKTTTSGGKGCPFTASAIAEDYLRLCRNPFSDLQRWLDEDKKTGNKIPATSSHGQRQ